MPRLVGIIPTGDDADSLSAPPPVMPTPVGIHAFLQLIKGMDGEPEPAMTMNGGGRWVGSTAAWYNTQDQPSHPEWQRTKS